MQISSHREFMQCNMPKDIVIMLESPVSEVSWSHGLGAFC